MDSPTEDAFRPSKAPSGSATGKDKSTKLEVVSNAKPFATLTDATALPIRLNGTKTPDIPDNGDEKNVTDATPTFDLNTNFNGMKLRMSSPQVKVEDISTKQHELLQGAATSKELSRQAIRELQKAAVAEQSNLISNLYAKYLPLSTKSKPINPTSATELTIQSFNRELRTSTAAATTTAVIETYRKYVQPADWPAFVAALTAIVTGSDHTVVGTDDDNYYTTLIARSMKNMAANLKSEGFDTTKLPKLPAPTIQLDSTLSTPAPKTGDNKATSKSKPKPSTLHHNSSTQRKSISDNDLKSNPPTSPTKPQSSSPPNTKTAPISDPNNSSRTDTDTDFDANLDAEKAREQEKWRLRGQGRGMKSGTQTGTQNQRDGKGGKHE